MFDIFDALALIGGLCLFLFGMNVMGDGLERRAGNSLKALLGKLTDNKFKGFLTGMGVTAVIQSSSATTVMVVGFVNSKVMTLKQSIGVIMGANIGTTVTSWLLSLGGISSDNIVMKLLKPMSFTPSDLCTCPRLLQSQYPHAGVPRCSPVPVRPGRQKQ